MRQASTQQRWRGAGIGAIALALLAVPAVFPDFLVYQFSVALTYAIAILGLNLLMGFNGQISVAQGVFFAVGAYTTAIFMTRYGVNYLATLPIAVATSSLLGLLVGVPALRWQGLPLAFITFGLAVLVPPLALKLEPITKGASGISMLKPPPPGWFPGTQDTYFYMVCLLGVAVCALIAWRLTRGDTGRSLRATRDNGLIAESLGVNLAKVRIAAFVTSAGFAGFGGGLFAIANAYVSPESFQMTKSFDFLVGAIVGGITSISGSLIGALFIVFLPDWSADMNIALSGLIYGGVLVVMMLVARDGVVGLLESLVRALQTRLAPPRAMPASAFEKQSHDRSDDRQFQT
jgi:branched-chain amino acid transport system permease protein